MKEKDRQFMAQKIRAQYMEKEFTELDELRALDAKVKRPATIFGYSFGSIGALVMGTGMSLIMTELAGGAMVSGILLGVVGMAAMIGNYPIYKRILDARRKLFSAQILTLSDTIIDE